MVLYIILNSTNNYPVDYSAANTKFHLLARGISLHQDDRCIVVDGYGNQEIEEIKDNEGIEYIRYSYFNSYKKIINTISIIKKIIKHYGPTYTYIMTSCPKFRLLLSLLILKTMMRVKIGYIFHEWHCSLKISTVAKLKTYIYDNYAGYFFDYILPISTYLNSKSKKFNKPTFMLPILGEYEDLENNNRNVMSQLTYCGQIDYMRIINIIIKAAQYIKNHKLDLQFNIVIYGNFEKISSLITMIKEKELNQIIHIYQSLTNKELFTLYQKSLALLIPLSKESVQDKARFSQKIAEYISSYRPIITNDVGDIKMYFKDNESAVILNELSPKELVSKILYLKDNPTIANNIGINGYKIGKNYFNYKIVSTNLCNFCFSL